MISMSTHMVNICSNLPNGRLCHNYRKWENFNHVLTNLSEEIPLMLQYTHLTVFAIFRLCGSSSPRHLVVPRVLEWRQRHYEFTAHSLTIRCTPS